MNDTRIAEFLDQKQFAVFGATEEPDMIGYKIVKRLEEEGYEVYPINPRIAAIDSKRCFGNLDEMDVVPQVVAIALAPEATLEILKCGFAHGVRRFWIQPGSESDSARWFVDEHGLSAVFHECLYERLGKHS